MILYRCQLGGRERKGGDRVDKLELVVVQTPAGVPLKREYVAFPEKEGGDQLSIGRDPGSDLLLSDPHRFVSGAHAMVVRESGQFYLRDISTNGVYLNGSEKPVGLNQQVLLADGDLIEIGEFQVRVDLYTLQTAASTSQPNVEGLIDRYAAGEVLEHRPATAGEPYALNSALTGEAFWDGGVLRMLGCSDVDRLSPEKARALEQLVVLMLKEALSGLQRLYSELPYQGAASLQTQHAQSDLGGNPLRFMPDIDQLLKALLGELGTGYKAPIASIREAIAEIDKHQRALHLGGEKTIWELFDLLSPDAIESQVDAESLGPGAKEALYWHAYKQSYSHLNSLFGRAHGLFSGLYSNGYRAVMDELNRSGLDRDEKVKGKAGETAGEKEPL